MNTEKTVTTASVQPENDALKMAMALLVELAESNHKLGSQVAELAKLLGQAWEIGSDHRKPSFEQLNNWRAAIAEATK